MTPSGSRNRSRSPASGSAASRRTTSSRVRVTWPIVVHLSAANLPCVPRTSFGTVSGRPQRAVLSRFWGVAMLRFRHLALAAATTAGLLLAPGAHATAPGFTVSGNKILDPTGATFTMRGSNILFDTELDGFG